MNRHLLAFLLFFSLTLQAQDTWPEPFVVSPDTLHYRSFETKEFQYITTGKDSIPFTKVITPEYSKRFKNIKSGKYSGFDDDENAWVRYRLKNPHGYPFQIIFPVDVKRSTVYVGKDNKWQHFTTGYQIPWERRDGIRQSRQIVYTIPANSTVYVYAYLSNLEYPDALFPNVGNYNTVVKEKFHNSLNFVVEDVVMGCFIGFILFAVVFNLLFFYISRERMYLVYAITLMCSVLYSLSDIVSKSFFLEGTRAAIVFQAGSIILLMVMTVQTLRLFFKFRQHYPRWDKYLLYTPLVLIILGTLAALAGEAGEIVIAIITVIAIIYMVSFIIGTFIILVLFLRKKDKDARLFVVAALPFFISLLADIFANWEWTVYCGGTWTILVL
jgi:two-component system, NtrC family, sensor kinase